MATQKEILKKKKKRWVSIISSSNFNNSEIGETITSEPSTLIGRNVAINLMNLTQDIKTQNTKIVFKIKEVKNDKLMTEIVKYELVPASLKRMIHKDKEKIDDSFKVATKDGVEVRIKPFIVTKSSTNRSVLTEAIKKATYDDFMEEVIRFKLQNVVKRELSKIYPLTQFQIRKLERLIQKS